MQIRSASRRNYRGFTLIEMIGVLAVIAILMSLLIPKVFEAINNSRINNAALSCQTVKTAIADHYAKVGTLSTNNTGTFDRVLLSEGFLDKPFQVKIGTGTNAFVMATNAVANNSTDTQAFNLDGAGDVNDATGGKVVFAAIPAVNAADAMELSQRIDGTLLSTNLATAADIIGRVKYAAPDGTTGLTDVYVYLTHR